MSDIPSLIRKDIEEELPHISESLRPWLERHIVTPRLITLSINPEGSHTRDFWLVTDEVGKDDSSYRIVYDPDSQKYGLEMTLNTGVQWYMGPYGTFTKAVHSL
jgi:hypothetical protein